MFVCVFVFDVVVKHLCCGRLENTFGLVVIKLLLESDAAFSGHRRQAPAQTPDVATLA